MVARPIYLIITQHFPSPETWRGSFVYDFACALLADGRYQVEVFTPGAGPDYTLPLPHTPHARLTVHRFRRRALRSAIFPFLFSRGNLRHFRARLHACGIPLDAIAVCHAHGVLLADYPLALKAANPRILTLLHHHHGFTDTGVGLGLLRHFGPHQRFLYRQFARLHARFDLHVFISRAVEHAFRALPAADWAPLDDYRRALRPLRGLPPFSLKAAYCLPNGVDPLRFSPAPPHPPRPFTLGCVANFLPFKDYPTLFRALAAIAPSLPADWCLRVIGTGPTRPACERLLRHLPALRGHLHFEPERPHEDLPAFYHSLDLFVLPSLFEGYGCVYAEAAACGVPFITCAGQGPDDWLPPDYPGRVPLRSPAALGACILRFLRAPWPAPTPPTFQAVIPPFLDALARHLPPA